MKWCHSCVCALRLRDSRGRPYVSVVRLASPEGRKLDQVVVGNPFHRVSGLAPGTQATRDYVHFESQLLQLLRHPGACGFARSSTVEINLLVLGEVLDFFNEVVGLDAD